MNNKENELHRLIDIAVSCCGFEGNTSISKTEVLGKSRKENIIMTRCILICLILHAGYSITTIAQLLNRTIPAIRHLSKISDNLLKTSRAYRIALSEATMLANNAEVDSNAKIKY